MNKDYNRILNLLRFNVCMNLTNYNRVSDSTLIRNATLLNHDPSYILEKYNRWIGSAITKDYAHYTPDDMTNFFHAYYKRWGSESDSVRNILIYLLHSNLNLTKMFLNFEEYIGPFDMIRSRYISGLHSTLEGNVCSIIENNRDTVKIILRDLKLRKLV